ncbi:RagB/SusD family nutrient uptake outer membrane protein [Olivibacter ginsenosidimutans]|uniref:RagB/SusD family nutrient uptake outer membrane protein n=1 Tax=Olivibacter ginsenosidimutans TaxID=1176537 RepID=A0ABP9B8B3_9SPHI
MKLINKKELYTRGMQHHKKSMLVVLLVFLLAACKKELNLVSQDTITDETFWKTANDFKLGANNLYNGLDRFGFEDTESDIAYNDPNAVSNGSYQPTENSGQWTTSYQYIRAANNMLEKGADKEDAEIRRYLAEAKFFRAWYYYRLLRIYGGVPLIDHVLTTDDPAAFTPRSTRTETVDFILNDLHEAQADLPKQKELADVDAGRITQGTALALIVRVALLEGTWQKFWSEGNANTYLDQAIAAAKDIMESGQYALYTGKGEQSYRYLFLEAGDDSPECILDRRYQRNILGHDAPYAYDQSGYNPTRKLVDLYLDKNGLPITNSASVFHGYDTYTSEFQDRDPRMTMTMIIPGTATNRVFYPVNKVENWPDKPQRNFNTGYILYKYMSEDATANNSGRLGDGSLFDYDRHLIRYAEILLSYAEAVFERNGQISDGELDQSINLIRKRAHMPVLTNAFVQVNGLNMRTEIRRERTVELALEGFRYDDLRRWKTAETEMKMDVKGIKVKGTDWQKRAPYSDPNFQNRVDANGFLIVETKRLFDPAKHYWQPLPTKEVAFYTTNGYTLTQNPGW